MLKSWLQKTSQTQSSQIQRTTNEIISILKDHFNNSLTKEDLILDDKKRKDLFEKKQYFFENLPSDFPGEECLESDVFDVENVENENENFHKYGVKPEVNQRSKTKQQICFVFH